jgi:hypothetical protein
MFPVVSGNSSKAELRLPLPGSKDVWQCLPLVAYGTSILSTLNKETSCVSYVSLHGTT